MQPDAIPEHPTPGMHIWGWMAPAELEWLRETASHMDSVVEIGSLRGRSSFALLTGCPGKVYCVDPWEDPGNHAWIGFAANCGDFANLVPVKGYSPEVADLIPDVDMVFLDGNHDYEHVVEEIGVWLPKTRKILCGHDYTHEGYWGVKKAVDEIFGDRMTLAEDTAIWVVQL